MAKVTYLGPSDRLSVRGVENRARRRFVRDRELGDVPADVLKALPAVVAAGHSFTLSSDDADEQKLIEELGFEASEPEAADADEAPAPKSSGKRGVRNRGGSASTNPDDPPVDTAAQADDDTVNPAQ